MELKEANENLKLLLNTAEKKYVHLTTVNTELQKRIDLIEQQSRIQNDSVYDMRMMFYVVPLIWDLLVRKNVQTRWMKSTQMKLPSYQDMYDLDECIMYREMNRLICKLDLLLITIKELIIDYHLIFERYY